jgi:hypothetical protein
MSRRTKLVATIICLVAIVAFAAWPVWVWLQPKPASRPLFERTKAVVERNPQLRPAWDRAMEDGVLTWQEAKEILESAGQTVSPDE